VLRVTHEECQANNSWVKPNIPYVRCQRISTLCYPDLKAHQRDARLCFKPGSTTAGHPLVHETQKDFRASRHVYIRWPQTKGSSSFQCECPIGQRLLAVYYPSPPLIAYPFLHQSYVLYSHIGQSNSVFLFSWGCQQSLARIWPSSSCC
jgi:hypothetical protein